MIRLLVVACLTADANACIDIRTPTQFASLHQCEALAITVLPEIMAPHPKRVIARFQCEEVRTEEAI